GGSSGVVSIFYSTNAGSAKPGIDYTDVSGELVFDNLDINPKSFSVPISDNKVFDGNKSVNLVLGNITGGALIGLSGATLTIQDDEVAQGGRIQFTQAGYSVNKDDGLATITVTRSANNTASTVDYSTSDGS